MRLHFYNRNLIKKINNYKRTPFTHEHIHINRRKINSCAKVCAQRAIEMTLLLRILHNDYCNDNK